MKKTYSLNRMILAIILVGFSILLVLLLALDWVSIDSYQTTNRRQWEAVLSEYSDELNNDMDEISAVIFSIYSSDSNYEKLQEDSPDQVTLYTASQELYERMYGNYMVENQIKGFAILYCYNGEERYQAYYDRQQIFNEDMQELRSRVVPELEAKGNGRYWLFERVNDKNVAVCACKKGNAICYVVGSLDETASEMKTELGQERGISENQIETCFVENGMVLFDGSVGSREEELLAVVKSSSSRFSKKQDGHYLAGEKIEGSKLWFCMDISRNFWSYMSIPQLFLLLLTLAAIGAELWCYYVLKRQLITPLLDLVSELNRIKNREDTATGDDGNPQIEVNTQLEELQLVNTTLNQTLGELTRQKDITYEQTIERQKAQMQYLSMQLKPHFYLNGLKTLNALAMNGDRQKIQDIIMRLSYHMRYILQLEKEMVFLQDEIDYVNNYADLQRDMTDRPLAIVWHVPEEGLENWKVPTLCIQTFVENSFKYAKVGNIRSQLLIHISIDELETEDGRFLDINIADNGSGYPDSTLEVINGEPVENSASVGINNLKRRCVLLYGNWAEYSFYNDDGAVSELILPWT